MLRYESRLEEKVSFETILSPRGGYEYEEGSFLSLAEHVHHAEDCRKWIVNLMTGFVPDSERPLAESMNHSWQTARECVAPYSLKP